MTSPSFKSPPFSQLTAISNHHHHHKPPLNSCHFHIRPFFLNLSTTTTSTSTNRLTLPASISSGVDSGGVSDDFVSTNSFFRQFSLIANMLNKIEPLDTSVISNGVSDSVKHSMKEMISTMLGLLPSDQFSVTVSVSKRPLVRLLASSLITGYTLWNAEYRIRLMRNFESLTVDMMPNRLNSGDCNDAVDDRIEEKENENEDVNLCDNNVGEFKRLNHEICLDDLSPDALSYIRKLELELSTANKDLHIQKQETIRIGYARENSNDLLKYLRSLDSDMMNELSRPSSSEVKEVVQQLVHRTSQRLFKENITPDLMRDSKVVQENFQTSNVIFTATRDYLAKLLFWCMLLGHQLRSLENRLYLSCAVGY